MVVTVEMYQQIRQLYNEGYSQREIARKLHISRNTVRKYCYGDTVPWERKEYPTRACNVITDDIALFIKQCLKEDELTGAKKQQHTAKRIYDRLVEEKQFDGGESTVRRYVQQLRQQTPPVFIPLSFDPAEAMQIDWGEITVYLKGEKVTLHMFCARLCYSAAPYVRAYHRQNSESFLDALVHTIEYFGGVPKHVIFDNARVAVKDGFGAHARKQDTYAALAAHYGFEAVFCNPASGNEKGLVEGLVGFMRRNVCVPVPHVETIHELNSLLEAKCTQYLNHKIQGKPAPVGELFAQEQEKFYPLPKYKYDPAKKTVVRVNQFSTVRFETNNYSVPVQYCGKEVTVRALPNTVEVVFNRDVIASHNRCFQRNQDIYSLEHYLPILAQKGRAIFYAKPIKDNVSPDFLSWLSKQNLSPMQLTELLHRCMQEGVDAVMNGSVIPLTAPIILDSVDVQQVDLSLYDKLFLKKEGAIV